MFRKINEGYVISDEGFKVKLGRHHVSYIEDDYAVRIERSILRLGFPHTILYDFSRLQYWYPPHENELVSKERKELMIRRVMKTLNETLNQAGQEYEVRRKGEQIVTTQKRKDPIKSQKENNQKENKKKLDSIRNKLP